MPIVEEDIGSGEDLGGKAGAGTEDDATAEGDCRDKGVGDGGDGESVGGDETPCTSWLDSGVWGGRCAKWPSSNSFQKRSNCQ